MNKRKGLKGLFNRLAASSAMAAALFTCVPSQAQEAQATPVETAIVQSCPAFPDFKRPEAPMLRQTAKDMPVDEELKSRQRLLRQLGINPGATDGLNGGTTRAAQREFMMFYAPLYNGDTTKVSLDDADALQLKKYADQNTADIAATGLSTGEAAALRLASSRSGVSFATLSSTAKRGGALPGVPSTGAAADDLFKFDNASWLYMVKNYGDDYGLGFYAKHITLETRDDGKTVPTVDNPFIHRQLLNLKNYPRISALMAGEYLKHRPDLSNVANPKVPAADPRMKLQQTDLLALGFDIGSTNADGIKGGFTTLAIKEFQMLHGDGQPTGSLSDIEAAKLAGAADAARAEGRKYNVPNVATGSIRMAADGVKDSGGPAFPYLMELASAESSFRVSAKASTSTATGLYQFIESTWAYMLLHHGEKHGLGDFSNEVETYTDALGRPQARFKNPVIRAEALEMRKNPQLSALFSADFQGDNKAKESCYVTGDLSRTDLYLAHFLGAHDAVYFITQMRANPEKSAVETFPEAAAANASIFYARDGKTVRDRSLEEVYEVLGRKFNRGLYDEVATVPVARPTPPKPPGQSPA